jgi:hypothetical protein
VLSAAAVVCPVVHTTLNWIAIATFGLFAFAILASVAWSMFDHRYRVGAAEPRRSLLFDGSPESESTGGHGSQRVPQPSKRVRW